jgi:hypothetical protein
MTGTSGSSTVGITVTPAGAVYTASADLIPSIPSTVTLAAATSGRISPLTASACYMVSCLASAAFRPGAGAEVALTTDNQLPAQTLMKVCLRSTETSVSFISSSATSCYAGRYDQ